MTNTSLCRSGSKPDENQLLHRWKRWLKMYKANVHRGYQLRVPPILESENNSYN